MKIKSKLLISFLAIYLITISALLIFGYIGAHKALKKQIFNQLESVVSTQHSRVESMIDQNLERLQLVTSRTQLRLSLNNYINNGGPSDLKTINKIIRDALASVGSFEEISVLDLQGRVIASTNSSMEGRTLADEEFFVRGKAGNIGDIVFRDSDGKLKNYLSGPLHLRGSLLGVLAIKSSMQDLIALTNDYSGMGETGETLLARRNRDGDALFLTPLRFAPDSALKMTIPKEDTRKPIIQALAENESLFEKAVDYRGHEVLSATRYIEKTKWGLVSKIDTKEAFRPINDLRYLLLVIIIFSSVLIVFVSIYLAGTITRPINVLAQFARRLSRGDMSGSIDIRSTDETGELARTFNEMVSGLAAARSKLEEKVSEQQRMRRQLEKELSERRQMEERLLLLQTSVDNAAESIFLIDRDGNFVQTNKAGHLNLGYTKEEILSMKVADIDPDFPPERWPGHWDEITKKKTMSFESRHRRKDGSVYPVEITVNYIQFGDSEYNFVFATDITGRKNAEARIVASLTEKEVLLRELHHRTKNNMQVISSLLNLQSQKIEDKQYFEMFLESRNRIRSMALIHEKLYRSDDLSNIDFEDYVKSIARNLLNTYEVNSRRVSLRTDIDHAALSIDTAIPCGLIINELLSNALKYAFPGDRTGEVTISFKNVSGNEYVLSVSDNGIGLPDDLDIEESKSLGLKLVTTLARSQLMGKLEMLSENGSQFYIYFSS